MTAPTEPERVVDGILADIDEAIRRVTTGTAPMRIPAQPHSDPDLVLGECRRVITSLAADLALARETLAEIAEADRLVKVYGDGNIFDRDAAIEKARDALAAAARGGAR